MSNDIPDEDFIDLIEHGIIAVDIDEGTKILYFRGFVDKPTEDDFLEIERALTEDPEQIIDEEFVLQRAPRPIVERYKNVARKLKLENKIDYDISCQHK